MRYTHWWACHPTETSHARFLPGILAVTTRILTRATPIGGFQAVTAIEIGPGAYRRYDITAHAAALSALVRQLGPGTQMRFHPASAAHMTDPLQTGVEAYTYLGGLTAIPAHGVITRDGRYLAPGSGRMTDVQAYLQHAHDVLHRLSGKDQLVALAC